MGEEVHGELDRDEPDAEDVSSDSIGEGEGVRVGVGASNEVSTWSVDDGEVIGG